MRVLIVDGEPLARADLARVLSARGDIEGFDTANDAFEARDKLGRSSFDVMLLDISMPEISGMELLDQLKENERSVPSVIFVTAYEEYAIAAFEKQAVDYVLKPFSAERLGEALNRAAQRTVNQRTLKLLEVLPAAARTCGSAFPQDCDQGAGQNHFCRPSQSGFYSRGGQLRVAQERVRLVSP